MMDITENKKKDATITIDGDIASFSEGETIYEVSKKYKKNIPTLCYDPRLEAFGSCRLCVVEVEGMRAPVASCTTRITPGMVVQTKTKDLDKYRRVLLEMVASENDGIKVDPLRGYASQELNNLLDQFNVGTKRFLGKKSGKNKEDENPFLLRDYNKCISCYRCVRVCAEQEGDHAISVMNRGFDTLISTEFNGILKDSSCTFCGQCVQTCPTGALGDKKAIRAKGLKGKIEKTRSICAYCGVGCSVDILSKKGQIIGIHPAMKGPANRGALCVKGQFAFDFVQHPDRLNVPLVRGNDGEFHETSWEKALDLASEGFLQSRDKYGRHSVYGIASGRAPTEAAYTMQKFIRAGFGTNQIDNCSRA